MSIDKAKVLRAVRRRVAEGLEAVEQSQRETQSGAVHEESKPENDKDTRAIEATYLARGLAQRVSELRAALRTLDALELRHFDEDDPAELTALVTVEDEEGEELSFFLSPAGAGIRVELGDAVVRVATTTSPVGQRLLGSRCDDEVVIRTPSGQRTMTITAIS